MKGIIQEGIKRFLDKKENCLSGVYGNYTAEHFNSLMRVINGTDEDFIIFSNGGGRSFDIWFNQEGFSYTASSGEVKEHPPLEIKGLVDHESISGMVYCYQIDGVQTWKQDIKSSAY